MKSLFRSIIERFIGSERPEFITEERSRHDVITSWIEQLNVIDHASTTVGKASQLDVELARNIGFMLFPIIDSISQTLTGGGPRKYLKMLGYSKHEADLLVTIFRNGLLHNTTCRTLVYDDGPVNWVMDSVSGTSGLPKTGRKAFSYYKNSDDKYIAHVELHYLVPQIRDDLNMRLESEPNDKVRLIVGQKVKGKRKSAPELEDDTNFIP